MDRNARTLHPRSGSSAKAILLTVLGEFTLPHSSALWTSTVVGSLGAMGIDERNARQAVARLAERGLVRSEKQGRRARWHFTDAGERLLVDGTKRIYEFGAGDDHWDGRWLVVLCSVPEEQRAKRHQLRSQLEFTGFGFIAAAVAISPHLEREGAATAILDDLDLTAQAAVFRAEAGSRHVPTDLLSRAWDLEALAAAYDEFIAAFAARRAATDADCFVALVELVHTWRRFPFVDPEIPARLLPAHWPGRRAKQLFDDRHTAWAPGANRWYEAVECGE